MKVTIAQIQMSIAADKQVNIDRACQKIREAARQGAQIAVLPEMFCSPYENSAFRAYGEAAGGLAQQALVQVAREEKIYVVGGSVPELEEEKIYNTCFVFDPEGNCIARHRKVHLFDIDVPGGQRFMESDTLSPGCDVTTFETCWGTMGLCICFDFRFQELSRLMALRGARVIFVPAAFNMTTGPAHWELLFRQRAVDNQVFTVGTSPARDTSAAYVAWGHSIVCEPWGSVVTHCDETEQTVLTQLDLDRVDAIRAQLPILAARREDVYCLSEK